MSLAGLLNTTATVERESRTADGQGGFTTATPMVATAVPCRLSAPSAADREAGGRLDARVAQTAYALGGADIRRGDRLIVGGRTFRVVAQVDPSIPSHHRKLLLEEVQTP